MDGMVVSVTTDGFITNVIDLEDRILQNNNMNSYLLQSYKKVRKDLSGSDNALELKSEDIGIIAWSTRGQLSGNGSIVATTGLQRRGLSSEALYKLLHDTINSNDKTIEFTESSLRSGLDILKRGGSVTNVYKDKTFRMLYDNRRIVNDKPIIDDLKDSLPAESLDVVNLNRFISKLPTRSLYNKKDSARVTFYKNNLDVAIRTFIRALFSKSYNLDINNFGSYKELIQFVKGFDKDCKLTENTIASLKRRPLNKRRLLVKDDVKVIEFVKYLKDQFPEFEDKLFLEQ